VAKHKTLPKDVLDAVNTALLQYFGYDVCVKDVSCGYFDEDWHYHVTTKWMDDNLGIFKFVIAKYMIDASVIRHQFESDKEKYRNGKVYRIYPSIDWYHYNGGSNGHKTEPEMIVIEKDLISGNWDMRLTLD
jgi:hypothetical protein